MKHVLVGKQVKAIEYLDVAKAKREGVENPYRVWRHDFKVRDAILLGLPDGSVLIKSRSGKRLWGFR